MNVVSDNYKVIKMQIAQKIRIFPDKQQQETLWSLSEICRKLYNQCLSKRLECWYNDYDISYYDQQNELPQKKKDNPELKCVYAKILQMIVRQLDKDFKSAITLQKIDEKASFPRFKGKKYFTTMHYNQAGFKVEFKVDKGIVKLSHKLNNTELSFKIPIKFEISNIIQVSVFMKDNKYFLSITYNKEPISYVDNGLYQAFDLGVTKHVAVNMNGKFVEFTNQRPDRYWKPKAEQIQSRRDHCKKHSRKWWILNNNYNRMRRKSSNQLKDIHHKLTRHIVDNTKANTIIVGDLSVKDLCKINKYQKGLHTSLHNTGIIGRFVSILTYKAELKGKKVVKRSERKTSKKCCCCGKEHYMPLHKRVMVCDCGNKMDRDQNSSVNIMSEFLIANARWTGLSEFQTNLRQTGIPVMELHS